MRKILFIINPAAGSGEAKNIIPMIKNKCVECNIEHEIKVSTRALGITKLTKDVLKKDSFTDIVAVGGDGTIIEIINAIEKIDIVVGLIPAGTGNDLARSLEIPNDFEIALEKIIANQVTHIDMGKVNGAVFVNSAGIGIESDIIESTAKIKKYAKGSSAYLLSTLKSIITYKPFEVSIQMDGVEFEREAFLIAIGNGKYFGGGMKITPDADLKSGEFQVCLVRKLSKQRFLRMFPKVYKGHHTDLPEVEMFICKELIIDSKNRQLNVSADGNIISKTPATIKVASRKLKVIT